MKLIVRFPFRPSWPASRPTRIAAIVVLALGLFGSLGAIVKTVMAWSSSRPALAIVEIDRGDIDHVVTETGSVEGSDDDLVRCEVESFLSLPSSVAVGNGDRRPMPMRSRPAASASLAAAALSTARGTLAAGPEAKLKGKTRDDGRQRDAPGKKGASPTDDSTALAGASDSSGIGAGMEKSRGMQRPEIRSFDHDVEPYVPLRSTLSDQGAMATITPPPPTILSIVPEGMQVKRGDVVCQLDSSGFAQALEVQRSRYLRATAWVEQVKYVLDASEIALREYQEGILPQDIQFVRQYIRICETERDQAAQNLEWSRGAFKKGFRTEGQVESDSARLELTDVTLRDARGMLDRLVRYTGKKVLTAHRAKVEAIRADKLSLETSFRLEQARLERIEAMIAHCTMRAPRDGIVVYGNRANHGGSAQAQIREGLTVYQSQPIFRLLDPSRMHVEARINESQVAHLRSGQPVRILLDAFPDRVLRGSVAEIMPMPSFPRGQYLDVHAFVANIRIDSGGFESLRTGLTAELEFLVETRRRVPRVPLEAIRWFADQAFAARVISTETSRQWLWKPIELGANDTSFAEIVSGLEPGDHVIAHAEELPPDGLGPPDTEVMMDLALEERQSQFNP